MGLAAKSLSVALGVTVCGLSGYLLYLLFSKDDEDDYDYTVAKASQYKTLEKVVPKDCVRALIGRNGQNIKLLQEQSNTRINFRDSGDTKICVIRGSSEGCTIAEHLIDEFIARQPVLECEDFWLDQQMVPKVIGRCGERINQIRTQSGCKLTVHDADLQRQQARISLKGTKEQILVAKSLVQEIVDLQRSTEMALKSREPRQKVKKLDSPKSERLSPAPGQSEQQFEVYVSAMVDPGRFWLQIVGPKATQLDCLVEEMSDYYSKPENKQIHKLQSVQVGDLVAAVFQYDNKWYRAEVLKVEDQKAELYYVDYGDTDCGQLCDLYELRTDFLRLHFQAIECYLAKIDPVNNEWSPEAIDKFEEWTHVAQWKKLSAKIDGYTVRDKTRAKREGSPVPGVDLFNVNNEQDMDIAKELVANGFAVYKKDADLRSNSRATSVSNLSIASSS